jgi:hypothetical protein
MKKYTLYLGLNDKDTKLQKFDTVTSYTLVNDIINNYLDGATISECVGYYKHEDGFIVIEKSLRIELLFANDDTVRLIVKQLKELFNQESVAVQMQEISSELW